MAEERPPRLALIQEKRAVSKPTWPRARTTIAEASSAVGSRERSKDRPRSTERGKSGGQTGHGHCGSPRFVGPLPTARLKARSCLTTWSRGSRGTPSRGWSPCRKLSILQIATLRAAPPAQRQRRLLSHAAPAATDLSWCCTQHPRPASATQLAPAASRILCLHTALLQRHPSHTAPVAQRAKHHI
jgi:hypothetical protein